MKNTCMQQVECTFDLSTEIAGAAQATLGMLQDSGVRLSLIDDQGNYKHTHSLEALLSCAVVLDHLKINIDDLDALRKRLIYMEACERAVSEINIAGTLQPEYASLENEIEAALA